MTKLIFKAHKKVIKQKGSKYFLLLNFYILFSPFLMYNNFGCILQKRKKRLQKGLQNVSRPF